MITKHAQKLIEKYGLTEDIPKSGLYKHVISYSNDLKYITVFSLDYLNNVSNEEMDECILKSNRKLMLQVQIDMETEEH